MVGTHNPKLGNSTMASIPSVVGVGQHAGSATRVDAGGLGHAALGRAPGPGSLVLGIGPALDEDTEVGVGPDPDLIGERAHELGEQRRRLDHVGVGVDHLHTGRHHASPSGTVEDDDAADHFARLHGPEGVVDVVEPDPAAHHALGVDRPPGHQVDHARGSRGRGRSSRRRSPTRVLAPTKSSKAEKVTCSDGDPAPTSTAVPPAAGRLEGEADGRRPAHHLEGVVDARGRRSGPGRRPRRRSLEESTTSVAPMDRAASSLAAMWSTATMVEAPARRAPWITDRPTPPQPITATVEPGSTPAVCQTAPIPVDSAHPTRAASSSGAARSTAHHLALGDEGLLGEGGRAEPSDELGSAHRGVGPADGLGHTGVAQHGLTGQAPEAAPARRHPGEHDVVAHRHPGDRPIRSRPPRPSPRGRARWGT